MNKLQFTKTLLRWYSEAEQRHMPWRGEKDPYLVWLSEIILQQTRVDQGMPYFERFKKRFPTIRQLALASEEEVLRLWQGLGYYSRARNLHATAKSIVYEQSGRFPTTYDQIITLKGVGAYTAAAIASFAFGEVRAVVDGNVIRFLSRVFGIDLPVHTAEGKRAIASLADSLIDLKNPADYNQAIMDFGSGVCLPAKPRCGACPFSKECYARKKDLIGLYPIQQKKKALVDRYFNFLVIRHGKTVLIQQRTGKDIWKNLWQFPLVESASRPARIPIKSVKQLLGSQDLSIGKQSEWKIQLLSHRRIHAQFTEVKWSGSKKNPLPDARFVAVSALREYAYPKIIHLFLEENSYFSTAY